MTNQITSGIETPGAAADEGRVRLSDVISAMSYALDITEGQPEGHATRSCWIGMKLAETIGLPEADRAALFYALLLKDLGCSSNAAKMCWLFKADDRLVKRDVKLIDWRKFLVNLRFGLNHVAPDGSWWSKTLALFGLAKQAKKTTHELFKTRCERGADIVRMLGFPEATAQAILGLDEHWDGNGHPLGLARDQIPLLGRICCLAQTVDVFAKSQDVEAAIAVAWSRRGSWFDPMLVDALHSFRNDHEFWRQLRTPNLSHELRALEPPDQMRFVTTDTLDLIAFAFAQVVDAKSPWTYRHSEGVAELAVGMATMLGWTPEQQRDVRRAGLLHDIGKLGISNLILDKPGRLTDDEYDQMKQHVIYTRQILSRVPCLQRLSIDAAAHHERLDGRGYPLGLSGEQISPLARMLCVADVCEALSAKRPYREPMPRDQIIAILKKDSGSVFCPTVVEAMIAYEKKVNAFTRVENRVGDLRELMSEVIAA